MTDTTAADADTAPTADPPHGHGVVELLACDLLDVLTALLTCTSTSSDYPALTSVRLQAGNGRLAGLSTDQYALGHASKPAVGTAEATLVPADAVRRMIGELADADRYELVRLQLHTDRIELRVKDATLGFAPVVIPSSLGGYPSRLVELLDVGGYEQIGVSGVVAFSPHNLARIAAATKTAGEHVVRCYFRAAEAPLRVEAGDWLVMLLMPYRTGGRYPMPQSPAIPVGLPDSPIAVQLNPVEPTAIGWPESAELATPQRLARHYAAHVQHLQNRMFHERFPQLPKYAEQSPTERRMAAAYGDMHAALVDSYAVSLLIRAFLEAAPAAAAAACRDLWESLEAGDSVGEETWEWLKADEIDPDALVDADIAAERFARAEMIAVQAFSTPPPVDPFARIVDTAELPDVDVDPPPAGAAAITEDAAAAAAFPTVEVTAAEIADDLGAIDRANARAREADEAGGQGDQLADPIATQPAEPGAYEQTDPWDGLPVADA
jgi:hypothetical protein